MSRFFVYMCIKYIFRNVYILSIYVIDFAYSYFFINFIFYKSRIKNKMKKEAERQSALNRKLNL